jgi:hypothetical protein
MATFAGFFEDSHFESRGQEGRVSDLLTKISLHHGRIFTAREKAGDFRKVRKV